MNQGLAIIIARTKTHPEEFCLSISEYRSKWLSLVDDFEKLMTDEEKEAWAEAKKGLNEYVRNKRRDDFTEAVMKELLVRDDYEAVRDDGVALNSVSHPKKPRPTKLLTAASMTKDALAILATAYPK